MAYDYGKNRADSKLKRSCATGQGATLDGPEYLNFMNFEAAGYAITFDSNSFAPDFASTATSISTSHKTYSSTINMDETGTVAYETIAEKLHSQKGYKAGVITSVNLNHTTPRCFLCPLGKPVQLL